MTPLRTLLAVSALTLGATASAGAASGPAGRPTDTVPRAATPPRRAEGEVTTLSVLPGSRGAEVIIGVTGPVEVVDFTLNDPLRLVLDLRGTRLRMPPRLYDKVVRGGVTNVRIAQYKDNIVRVVLDLNAVAPYVVTKGDDGVHVMLGGGELGFAAWYANPAPTVLTAQADGQLIEQGATPATPLLVAPPAAAPSRAAAPPASAEQAPLPRSNVLSRPRVTRPNATPVPQQQSQQPRITVTYQDADIRDVLAAFAAFSGRTIVVGKGVSGTVTAEVRDQPWDVALRAILQSQGLAAQEDENGIITVDSYQNIAAQQALEPLTTQIVPVNYARASSLAATVATLLSKDCLGGGAAGASGGAAPVSGTGTCVTRGSVSADTATNRLLITDVPGRLAEIIAYIRDLDFRTPQVAIKAKIIFVNRTDIEDLGITYDLGSQTQFFNRLVQRTDPSTFQPVDTNGDGVPDAVGGGTAFPSNQNVIDLGGNALAALANANQRVVTPALELIFSTAIGKYDLTAFLDALQEVRLADIQAEPSVVTLDNRQASIVVGEETPIRVIDLGSATGGVAGQQPRAAVNFRETGIILRVTPHVTNNRQILMTLHSERSALQAAASDLGFTFAKQEADNQLLVADGETAVIGGLTVTQVTTSKSGIPLLVDLPLLGRLFGRTFSQEEKRDLLILVTPHIIDEGEQLGVPGGSPGGSPGGRGR